MRERQTLELSFNEVAEQAQVNPSLIGYYFGSKRGFMLALMERDSLASHDDLKHLLESPYSPMQKLRYHVSGMINFYERYPYINRLLGLLTREAPDAEARDIAERFIKPIVSAYEQLIQQGVECGEFRPMSAMNLYFMMIGMCEEVFVSRSTMRYCFGADQLSQADKRAFIADVTAFCASGIRPQSAQ